MHMLHNAHKASIRNHKVFHFRASAGLPTLKSPGQYCNHPCPIPLNLLFRPDNIRCFLQTQKHNFSFQPERHETGVPATCNLSEFHDTLLHDGPPFWLRSESKLCYNILLDFPRPLSSPGNIPLKTILFHCRGIHENYHPDGVLHKQYDQHLGR